METQFWWGMFMDCRKIACENGSRMELAQNHAKLRAFRLLLLNLLVPLPDIQVSQN
jgi:hypothetical protein